MTFNLTTSQILIIVVVVILALIIAYVYRRSTPRLEMMQTVAITSNSKPATLYYFFLPGCGHCAHFKPTWDTLVQRLKAIPNITTKEINGSDPANSNLMFYYGVESSPTLILETSSATHTYEGNRSAEDLERWVREKVHH